MTKYFARPMGRLVRHGLLTFGSDGTSLPGVATLSWYGLERPCNRLKRLFPYEPAARAMPIPKLADIAPAVE